MTSAVVELYVDGTWTDITSDVYTRNPISITRGRSDEASQAQPASCQITLNNRTGKYSPRNPMSPYYGKIGRNTPVRVGVTDPVSTWIPWSAGGFASTPDNAAFDITGDIDIRAEVQLDALDGPRVIFADRGMGTASSKSWRLYQEDLDNGAVRFEWSTNGTSVAAMATSTEALPVGVSGGRIVLRVTMDVNNGSGSREVKFWTSSTWDGPWNQLGSTVTGATTSIFAGSAGLYFGRQGNDLSNARLASGYRFQLRNGIDGTVVANPDFTVQTPGATSFADSTGKTWTMTDGPVSLATDWRFYGEVASFPPRWDEAHKDQWVPIQCSGLLRRIGQGSQPVNTGYKSYLLGTNPVTYWPLDDANTSLVGKPAPNSRYGYYNFERALDSTLMTFGEGDLSPLPSTLRVEDTNPGAADFLSGLCIGSYVAPGSLAMDFIYKRNPVAAGQKMSSWTVRLYTYGTDSTDPNDGIFDLWGVQFRADGVNNDVQVVLQTDAFGVAGGPTTIVLNDSGPVDAVLDQELHHVRFTLHESGSGTDYEVFVDGVSTVSGSRAGYNLRNSRTVWAFYDRASNEDMLALGHIIVWERPQDIPDLAYTSDLAHSFVGEVAGRRFERLCAEAGVQFVGVGNLDDSMPMGAQFTDYFSNQLSEIEATDRGLIFEPRGLVGVSYRPRTDLYNQPAVATLDYSAGQLSPPFEPVDDDQLTRNDIFAQRREGGSAQATLESGPLSVQDPPNGVGRYKDEVQLNVESDGMLPGIAQWLLLAGTIDAARFPSVTVNLANPAIGTSLAASLLALDIGDRLVITNASAANIYEDISVLVLGYTETIGPVEHTITYVCAPDTAYTSAVWGSGVGTGPDRYDTGGSLLNGAHSSSATSLSVAKAAGGALWTTDAGEFPFDIFVGGERMTVLSIAGVSSPQIFTVTRSVNGVVKAHDTGTAVRLWKTPRYAL